MKSKNQIIVLMLLGMLMINACNNNPNISEASMLESNASPLPDTTLGNERIIIKTAEIRLNVNKVEESIQHFQTLVNQLDGHVYHYEIDHEKQLADEVQHTLDSNILITNIHPTGMMKVKIPFAQSDRFISEVLAMDGDIDHFLLDENDVTEDIHEKKNLMLLDANGSTVNTKNKNASNTSIPSKETLIKRTTDFAKLNYQTKHLWFDIHFNGLSYQTKQMTLAPQSISTPFFIKAYKSLQDGWHGISFIVIALLKLWPLILMALIILFIVQIKGMKKGFSSIHTDVK